MPNEVSGMIRAKGLVGAIEAADAIVKAVNMVLIGCEKTGSGLVTVMVYGDIGVVRASVDAGVAAADAVGEAVPRHMILRSHPDTERILP